MTLKFNQINKYDFFGIKMIKDSFFLLSDLLFVGLMKWFSKAFRLKISQRSIPSFKIYKSAKAQQFWIHFSVGGIQSRNMQFHSLFYDVLLIFLLTSKVTKVNILPIQWLMAEDQYKYKLHDAWWRHMNFYNFTASYI